MGTTRTSFRPASDAAKVTPRRRPKPTRAVSPYMRVTPIKSNNQRRGLRILDTHSPEAHFIRRCKRMIVDDHFAGRKLTTAEQSLLHRIAMIELRCELLDREFLASDESGYDEVQYIARTNTLIKLYTKLGIHRGHTDMAALLRKKVKVD
jgi:hypothetical protein